MNILVKTGLGALIITTFVYMVIQKTMHAQDGIRIALLTPVTHPALQEVEQGFKETLQQTLPSARYTTFNANGNKTLLRAQAEELVAGNYDLIFTMGAGASQTVAELLSKKQLAIPHVFSAIDGHQLAYSLQKMYHCSTGAYLDVDYTKHMDMLFTLKPDIKTIVLVYDPMHGTGLEPYKRQLADYVKKFGANLHAIEVYSPHEIQQKVSAALVGADAVFVLIDNTVVSGIDALITLCNKHSILLMVSDIPSGKKGATIAYGITEYESGAQAAHKAAEILVEGKEACDIAVTPITTFNLLINKNAPQAESLHRDTIKEDHA